MLQMQHVFYTTYKERIMDYEYLTKYEDSLFYQIHVSAKIFHMLFDQFFKELKIGLSANEHLALKIISETKDCCQRDLARILLKDRSNTGKLVNFLKEQGYIEIKLSTKNNRPVKILTITKKGSKIIDKMSKITEPIVKKIQSEISKEVIEETKKSLQNFIKVVEKAVKTNI